MSEEFEPGFVDETPVAETGCPHGRTVWSNLARCLRIVLAIAMLGAFVVLITNVFTSRVRVDGPSMEPRLHRGAFVIVDKITYLVSDPHRGDVVVFSLKGDKQAEYIKRLIGLPGERIEVQQGQMYIDGKALNEPYVAENTTNGLIQARLLGPDEYFVLGDNRVDSRDSRNFGAIRRGDIIGRARLVYWPLKDWGLVRSASGQ